MMSTNQCTARDQAGTLIEQPEAHIVVGLLLLLLLLGGLLLCGSSRGGGGSRGSSSERIGVGKVLLDLVGTLEAVLGRNGNSEQVLVRVDERMGDGGQGRVVERKRDRGNGLDTRQEAVDEDRLVNVKDVGGEDVALVEDLDDSHSVGERRDVKHVQEGRLGSSDTGSTSNDLDVGHDFNSTTSDLGWDTESLEERGLAGLHTGVTSGDGNVGGRIGTSTGRGSYLVRNNDLTNVLEVTAGEDETDVAPDMRE